LAFFAGTDGSSCMVIGNLSIHRVQVTILPNAHTWAACTGGPPA
jgi:hypothetical protein